MAIAQRIQVYLAKKNVSFQVVSHAYSETMWESAVVADLLPAQVAKAVLLKDQEKTFIMAVIPARRWLDLHAVNAMLDTTCTLAQECDIFTLFDDCAPGAIPAVGEAYGIETIWDSHLNQCRHVYFEAGDHATFIDIGHESFEKLFIDLPHDDISVPMRVTLDMDWPEFNFR